MRCPHRGQEAAAGSHRNLSDALLRTLGAAWRMIPLSLSERPPIREGQGGRRRPRKRNRL